MSSAPIERVRASAYTIPTESTESDGTHVWNRTTLPPVPERGRLRPDRWRPGLGIELRENVARPYLVY